jgi:hypothetical protein
VVESRRGISLDAVQSSTPATASGSGVAAAACIARSSIVAVQWVVYDGDDSVLRGEGKIIVDERLQCGIAVLLELAFDHIAAAAGREEDVN